MKASDILHQTRGRVFHPISKHREVVESRGAADETPSPMFDIAPQTIHSSWRKSKQKFTKFYDN